MKTKPANTNSTRSRAEILAEIANLPPSVQGKICEFKHRLASGKVRTYHNLQYWADGRNHTIHIPDDKLAAFKEAAKNGARLKELVTQLTVADAATILSDQSVLKKNSSDSSIAGRSGSKRS